MGNETNNKDKYNIAACGNCVELDYIYIPYARIIIIKGKDEAVQFDNLINILRYIIVAKIWVSYTARLGA